MTFLYITLIGRTLFSLSFYFVFWHVTELRNYKYRGHYGGNKVGNRERQPHAVDAYLAWQEYQQRNQEHHLTQQPDEDGFGSLPYALNKAVEII